MTILPCTVEGCDRKHFGRGYCSRHYYKWSKYGDPLAGGTRYKTPEESFAAHAKPMTSGCIVWTGTKNAAGYGLVFQKLAHRYAWERNNGPIPDGLFIDHICHVRHCVNVEHLRLATSKQNNENRTKGASISGIRGVTWDKSRRKWAVNITHERRTHNLGRFDDLEEAAEVARAARLRLFTHNNHDRVA